MRPDVEQQITSCRHGIVPRAAQLTEVVQGGWSRRAEEAVPERGAQTDDTGQCALGKTEPD